LLMILAVNIAAAQTVSVGDMAPVVSANSTLTTDQAALTAARQAYATAFATWQALSSTQTLLTAITTTQAQVQADQGSLATTVYGVCKKYTVNCSNGQNVLSLGQGQFIQSQHGNRNNGGIPVQP